MARPRPRGRAPRTASALASSSSSCGSVGPRRAGLLDERAEHAVVAGHRAGVRRRGGGAHRRRADLQHRDPDARVRAGRQRVAQAGAVAGVLDQQRDRAHLRLGGQVLEVVRRRQHRLVPARDRGVQPQPAPRRERVDGEVAALRHERDVARLLRHQRVAPQRRAGVESDQAVAVGTADGERVAERRGAELSLERAPRRRGPAVARGRFAEARGIDDGAAASERARFLDDLRHPRPGSRRRPRRARRAGRTAREARDAVGLGAAWIDAPQRAVEPNRGEVEQRLTAVVVAVVGGSHDGDRARVEEPGEIH